MPLPLAGIYIAGLSGTCVGVVLVLESQMGLDAWNAVFAGLEQLTPLTFGMWSMIIQGSFWALASLLDHKADFLCIFPIIWKGIILDLAKAVIGFIPFGDSLWIRFALFFTGYAIVGIATGVYVATGCPKMPIDGLMSALSRCLSWDIKKARLLIEVTGFVVMLLVGGPFGVGTVIITFTIGYLISAAKRAAGKSINSYFS